MHGLAVIALATLFNTPLADLEKGALASRHEECYASSMIGYDYVINSRAGLPIERALNTVSVDQQSEAVRDTYKYFLKEVVNQAYQWQGTPHAFATRVMFSCAYYQGQNKAQLNADGSQRF